MRLLSLICAVLMMAFCAGAEDTPEPLAIGADAPAFSLPGIDGNTWTLKDFADAKILVVVFTCNHCPTAQSYEDRIQALARDYSGKGVALVAISPNDPLALRLDELGYTDLGDSFEDMKQRAEDKRFEFPYLYDGETQEASRKYGPVSTPHVFIFDADRKLRYRGRMDDSEKPDKVTTNDARNAIDALLAGTPVPVETTKTSGCSTKWSEKRQSVKDSLEKWAAEPVTVESIDSAGVQELVANKSDKLRFINVYATWCGPCIAEFPDLIEINRMYRIRDFEMVTISADDPKHEKQVQKFLEKNQASTRNYLFDNDDVYKLIEALDPKWEGAFPYTLIIKPGGGIVYRQLGQIDPLETKRAIVEQLGRAFD